MWGPRVVALLLAPTLSLLAAPRQAPSPQVAADDMIAVGFACNDGTFVPLAARTKGTWRPLSVAEERVDYFFAILTPQGLRLPRQAWTLYPRAGESPRSLSLRSLRKRIDDWSECAAVQAFDSDVPRVPGRLVLPTGDRLPTAVGIGVRGQARFEHVDEVTEQPDDDSRRVARLVVREVDKVERRLARVAADRSPLEQFSGRKEVRSVVRLATMVRHRSLDSEWYFFQARKRYGEWYVFEGKRQYKVWASVLVHGWVRASAASLSAFRVTGVFEDDDGKDVTMYRMAGVLTFDNRQAWLAEVSQYEQYSYELFEIGAGDSTPHSVVTVVTGAS